MAGVFPDHSVNESATDGRPLFGVAGRQAGPRLLSSARESGRRPIPGSGTGALMM